MTPSLSPLFGLGEGRYFRNQIKVLVRARYQFLMSILNNIS